MTIDKSFEIYELLRKHIKDVLATKQDIADAKFDLLKWILVLIVGQTGVLFALLKFAFNK